MDEIKRLHQEHHDAVRAELIRERSEKKAQQTHMNIAHERMGRNISELQQQLQDVQTKHSRILCPGGPDTQTATTKRMIKQMEDEMLQIRQNIAESHANAPNFNTHPLSDAGGDAMSGMQAGGTSPYGGAVQQPTPIPVPAI